MSKLYIEGGYPLAGEVSVAGNKNAALPILAATLLTDDEIILKNLPDILDVRRMVRLLECIGKKTEYKSRNIIAISGAVSNNKLPEEHAGQLRASILLLAGLLLKTGEAFLFPPGGCVIGRRKVDSHFEMVEDFGGEVVSDHSGFHITLGEQKAASIFLKEVSVTATENVMILAAGIKGRSVIQNAACEPHVVDLAEFLVKLGAKIEGAGTNRIMIEGSHCLTGAEHSITPDPIEAGTFAIAAAATGGEMVIHNAMKEHFYSMGRMLRSMNVMFKFQDEKTLHLFPSKLEIKEKKLQVGLWPNFPTDLMSPAIVLATQAKGSILCHDWMFESRMFFVDKLNIMGADIIQADPHRVIVNGPTKLYGQHLTSPDIRAGIALVIAALAAQGNSVIDNIETVDRGYEEIENRLNHLGSKVRREEHHH
ncbi:MAG: UDP-N-acetylglucosamine 1-carboxyvinyltransferase [Candidatus Marinimicrobia bacterium]|nr:UDP-N-acetylglucosamine 1-carboxyvinyltransferase [Candidatus Neomarinimicrobiota bacterium]